MKEKIYYELYGKVVKEISFALLAVDAKSSYEFLKAESGGWMCSEYGQNKSYKFVCGNKTALIMPLTAD